MNESDLKAFCRLDITIRMLQENVVKWIKRKKIVYCLESVTRVWRQIAEAIPINVPKKIARGFYFLISGFRASYASVPCEKSTNFFVFFLKHMTASQGECMFPCSPEKIGGSPLFPKNKIRCSLKFTLVKFPCSQKFYCMFPWSPEIFFNVPQNFLTYFSLWWSAGAHY